MRHPGKKQNAGQSAEPKQPSLGDFGVGVIESRLERMLAHTAGAKSGDDTNAIHQMRVWSRRSRASLDVFAVCFEGKTQRAYAELEAEVKAVTQALGGARDLDVMMQNMRARETTLPPEQRAGLHSFLQHLQQQRDKQQEQVDCQVQELEARDIKQRFRDMADRQGYKPAAVLSKPVAPTLTEAPDPVTPSAPETDPSERDGSTPAPTGTKRGSRTTGTANRRKQTDG